jgi:hypothetical protein
MSHYASRNSKGKRREGKRRERERERRTSLYGFAMNVGVIPYFIPTLFATNLNRIALSAIRPESVYARAVSKTPGPVSVSAISTQSGR